MLMPPRKLVNSGSMEFFINVCPVKYNGTHCLLIFSIIVRGKFQSISFSSAVCNLADLCASKNVSIWPKILLKVGLLDGTGSQHSVSNAPISAGMFLGMGGRFFL